MHPVLKFVAYLYLKVALLIGYDFFFEREDILGRYDTTQDPQTHMLMYAATMLLLLPILDTIIIAMPIYISLKYRDRMKWIMLAITFLLEFIVYYFAIVNKTIAPDLVLKSVFSIFVFLVLYRKQVFAKTIV